MESHFAAQIQLILVIRCDFPLLLLNFLYHCKVHLQDYGYHTKIAYAFHHSLSLAGLEHEGRQNAYVVNPSLEPMIQSHVHQHPIRASRLPFLYAPKLNYGRVFQARSFLFLNETIDLYCRVPLRLFILLVCIIIKLIFPNIIILE